MANFIELDLSLPGWPHAAACLVAMAAFFPVMFVRKGGAAHRAWGRIYVIAYLIACVTALGIYRQNKFFFPHWFAIGGLVVLAAGCLAARYKPRGWRIIHLTGMVLSAYNLFAGAVNEAFFRIKALRATLGENPFMSPVLGTTHAVLFWLFFLLIVGYIATLDLAEWRRYPVARTPVAARPDYGIDAPQVLRNLFLVSAAGISLWTVVMILVKFTTMHIPQVVFALSGMGFGTGVLCMVMGIWMLWESKIGKLRGRDRLLDRVVWTGSEQVLDVGCGRGLILMGAAKRLRTGKATGIDVWQAEDLTRNHADATIENARREGVADRVEVRTADMRQMPFADNTFDVIVSRAAIHNIHKAPERAAAIREIARVLKPGGQAIIEDIRHHREYALIFTQNGCADLRRAGSLAVYLFFSFVTFGSLRPATLLVRKSASRG